MQKLAAAMECNFTKEKVGYELTRAFHDQASSNGQSSYHLMWLVQNVSIF